MWFGTKDGLNRYDGNNFRIFRFDAKNPASLGNNFIRCLIEGEGGDLYIGTDAGLYIMNTVEETFIKVIGTTTAVNTLYADQDGNIWIGSIDQGVFRYNPESKELEQMELSKYNLDTNSSWVIYGDLSGTIWSVTAWDYSDIIKTQINSIR